MKKVFLLTVLMTINTWAQTPAAPATLGGVMKAMSATLKKVTAQAADEKKNADSEQLVNEMVAMTTNAKNHMPKTVRDLPADQQTIQQQQYLKLVDEMLVIMQDLATAFHDNNNAKAADILSKISAAKKEGHNQFK